MEVNSGEAQPQPQFEVPVPQEGGQDSGEIQQDQALERGAPDESRVGKAQPQKPAVTPPVIMPADDDQAQAAGPPATDDSDNPGQAKEGNVIEKDWIDKAKAIIAQTQEDPFIQKKEMSKVKADYIRKRFNKTIPTDDTVGA